MTIPMVPLGEIATPVSRPIAVTPGTSYRTFGVKWWGMGAYERETIDGSQTAARTLFIIREGDLVINKIWVRHGSVAIASGDVDGCAASAEFPTFELDSTRVLPRWVHWHTKAQYFWEKCARLSHGTSGKNRIRPELFLTIKIPLPSLDEQRRIVARIEELAALIEEAQELRVKAREEARALLDAALQEVFAAAQNETWDHKQVKELCTPPPQYGYTESAQLEEVGPKFLRITDIQNGMVNWDTVPYCVCYDVDKYRLQPGDILFARTGATTGKSFLVKECPEAVFASYLIRLQLKPGLEPEYLYWFFQSPQYWAQVHEEKKGSAQANMNGRKLSKIVVLIAPSEEERNRIVAYLDDLQTQVDQLTATQDATQGDLEALLPSVLDQAFRGEL